MANFVPKSLNYRIAASSCLRVFLFRITLILLCTFCCAAARGQSGTFTGVKLIPVTKRAAAARDIYKVHCRKIPAPAAMKKLDSLTSLAREMNDLSLEDAVFEMRADYYSVNNGFNPKSLSYYDQAISFAQKNGLRLDEGIYIHKKAIYYSIFKYNTTACQYFLDAQQIFTEIGYDKVPDIGIYLWEFAEFYYSIGAYYECRKYLYEALQHDTHSARNRINMTNTIGLIYRNYGQYQQALGVFNKVLRMASVAKDTAWIGIANGNIGSVYFMQGQYVRSLPYIQTDYMVSLKYQEYLNGAIALLRLAKISLETDQLQQAYTQLITIEFLLTEDNTPANLKYRAELYKLKAIYFERVNDLKDALSFRKRYEITRDSLIKQDNIAAVDRVSLQWEIDNHLAQVRQLKTDNQMATIKMAAVILLLLLLMTAYSLRYRRKILQAKKDKEQLLSAKSNVDEELKNASAALMVYTENLRKKNQTIEAFRKKIEQMEEDLSDKAEIEKLDKMIQTHIMTDETWNEFKKLFGKVHGTFFNNLASKFPQISVTDTRLLALIKLGLNNREMANMLGITVEGIKKAKQRLRKKMGLGPDDEIEKVVGRF